MRCRFKLIVHFKIRLCFLIAEFPNSLYSLDISPLSDNVLFSNTFPSIFYINLLFCELISSKICLVHSLEIFIDNYVICAQKQLYFFLSNLYRFFALISCLATLARASSMMLNTIGKKGHPHLVPNFRGNTSSFSPLNMMTLVVFCFLNKCSSSSIPSCFPVYAFNYFTLSSSFAAFHKFLSVLFPFGFNENI